jgi:hypothetical protein
MYAKRVLRLQIAAVKNSMKQRLARSPTTRTIAGSASSRHGPMRAAVIISSASTIL